MTLDLPSLTLLAVSTAWQPVGPTGITDGQVENIAGGPVAGAVNTLAVHPENPDILYAGSVNGGIWRTTNATATAVQWQPQTDGQASLSIGSVRFDPTDPGRQTLVASIGRSSAFNNQGGSRSGVLYTVNGGENWQLLSGLEGRNLTAAEASGGVIVAASNGGDTGTCSDLGLYRSSNSGETWGRVENGLPAGVIDALARSPVNPDVLYAAVLLGSLCSPGGVNGIYRSDDFGLSWQKVSPSDPTLALDAVLEDLPGTHVEMAVGPTGNLFVVVVPGSSRQLEGVFFTNDGGQRWGALDLPGTFEPSFVGIHPSRQGFVHLSVAADPVSPNVLYVGGDRQPQSDSGSFPNAIGANDFSGRLFRGDASQPAGFQWTTITHAGTFAGSAPHADSRELQFDAAGQLLDAGDGGIYRQSAAGGFFGDWFSVNGNLQVTESHSGAVDSRSGIFLGGNQDTGSTQQSAPGSTLWETVNTGDGGDVAVAYVADATERFHSFSFFGNPTRRRYNAAGDLLAITTLALQPVAKSPQLEGQFVTPLVTNNNGRLLIGGANGVFQSLDLGDTVEQVLPDIVVNGFLGNALVLGSATNPDLVYAAGCEGDCGSSGIGQVFLRQLAGADFTSIFTGVDPGGISAISGGADDASLFVLERNRVVLLTDFGSRTSDLTADLLSLEPGRFRSLLWLPGSDAGLLVGANRGVFAAFESSGYTQWTNLDVGLPNSPVMDLSYDLEIDRLLATTLGRGSFVLEQYSRRQPRLFADGFE